MPSRFVLLVTLGFLGLGPLGWSAQETQPLWGTSTLTLKPACAGSPSLSALLTDHKSTVSLARFYRAGGDPQPATPTECRMAYNAEALFVVFRCAEPNPAFAARDHDEDWYATPGSEVDNAFPDKVELFLAPDLNHSGYYQFVVTKAGVKFGSRRGARPESPPSSDEPSADSGRSSRRITAFEATVTPGEKEWTVWLKIPWQTVGGKPAASFGLLPLRTRWRDGEVSSPVALDFGERPAPDLFIETWFALPTARPTPPPVLSGTLLQLPSGTLRWQRPARLAYPDAGTLKAIWLLQQSLAKSTDSQPGAPASLPAGAKPPKRRQDAGAPGGAVSDSDPTNLAHRISLTQSWLELLVLEGCNFRPTSGSIAPEDLSPLTVRRQVNAALQTNAVARACQALDTYLHKLDAVSRKWFADGSPGDVAVAEWQPLSALKGLETNGPILVLHCLAGDKPVDLHLAAPKSGSLRLYGEREGYFKPAELLPLEQSLEGTIKVEAKPFRISVCNATGRRVFQIHLSDLAFRFGPDGQVLAADFQHPLQQDEAIFGFGEKYDCFNQHGNVLTLWGVDDWTGLTVGLRNQSYKPVPLFHSSQGYTVFVNSSYRLRADMGKTHPGRTRLTQHGPVFDYYFWVGAPERAIESYTTLTGKPCLPPKWAFEPWMGRTGRGWAKNPRHDPVAEQERVVSRFAELDIPHSALYAEGAGADSPALHAFLAARGIKVLSWYYPAIGLAQQKSLLPEVPAAELPLLNTTSNRISSAELSYVDFTHTNALELSRRWWARRLSLGLAGSMVDFGDRVPEEALFFNHQRGDELHNFYAYDYHRTYQEVFREKRGDDFILFGRAAAPGTQRWVAQFGGDHPANFRGLQDVMRGALNLSACGFSTWGSDLGGFLGWPEPEVYMRWTQFACFSPLMRAHGRTPREPWEYGESAVANYKRYAWLRENLLDYIYQSAVTAHQTGRPLMRSMAVAFPHEHALVGIDDQYLFGPDLLVAPVVSEGGERTIVFPPGKWASLWDGTVTVGPAQQKVRVPLDQIPVFLRSGAVVPVQLAKDLRLGESMTGGRTNALLVTAPEPPGKGMQRSTPESPTSGTISSDTDGFTLALNPLAQPRYLLLYSTSAVTVKADGSALPQVAEAQILSGQPGWHVDSRQPRTLVCLPAGAVKNIAVALSLRR